MNKLVCRMCLFEAINGREMNWHTIKKHKNDANFIVTCTHPMCNYTCRNVKTFRSHLKIKHKETIVRDNNRQDELQELNDELPCEEEQYDATFDIAKFLLSIEAKHNVSMTCVDTIVNSTRELMNTICDRILSKVEASDRVLAENIREELQHLDVFGNLETNAKRENYLREKCFLIKPREVLLKLLRKNGLGKVRWERVTGHIIPFRQYLEVLLSLPEVNYYCFSADFREEGGLKSELCHGDLFKRHPVFSNYPDAIQIILYYDEIALTNVMRSKFRDHKLAMWYFSIGNLPSKFRSTMHNMHLLGILKSKDMRKYGLSKFLRDFIDTVNKLNSDGIRMTIGGVERIVRGDLIIVQTDSPAGSYLAGMKESMSFALRGCRLCNAKTNEWKSKFRDVEFKKRSLIVHERRLRPLKDKTISKTNLMEWSKLYGINKESFLKPITGFNYLTCIPYDPFHIFLEGEFDYVTAIFLYKCIFSLEIFTLDWLNSELQCWKYSYLDAKDKIVRISKSDLEKDTCKQTAASMLIMAYILPHLIFWKMDFENKHFQMYIKMTQIVLLATSPYCDQNTPGELDIRINDFYSEFKRLYPNKAIHPKAHQAAHLSFYIKEFSSPRLFWNMRWEAKHNYFKGIKWKNFKNLPKSLSEKHSKFMAYKMCGSRTGMNFNFVYCGVEIGDGRNINVQRVYYFLSDDVISKFPKTEMFEMNWVRAEGHTYKQGVAILLSWENDWPSFGIVEAMLTDSEGYIYFLVDKMETIGFKWMLNSYEIRSVNIYDVVCLNKIYNKFPLPIQAHCNRLFVTNRFCHFQHMWF